MKKDLKTEFSTRQKMLSKDFELYYYSDRVLPDVKAHTHENYEFYFFTQGHVTMHVGKDSFVPSNNTVLIIPPTVPHYAKLNDGDIPYRRFVFWVSKEFMKSLFEVSEDYSYLTNKALSDKHYFIHHFNDIEFNTIQGKLFSIIDEDHSDRFGKQAKLLNLISDLILTVNRMVYESEHQPELASNHDSLYQSIIQYIETHIDEKLTLDEFAEIFHVNKFHISHIFTEANGLSIRKYITKKRLDMCRDAILSGQDIYIVASSYGFSDYSVFYRAFTKEFGKSPKKYRDEVLRSRVNQSSAKQ